jgi:hypothetical protein
MNSSVIEGPCAEERALWVGVRGGRRGEVASTRPCA